MTGWRWLAVAPSAGGAVLCLMALAGQGAPALAAQDMLAVDQHAAASMATSAAEPDQAATRQQVAVLEARHLRLVARRHAEARRDRRQAAAAAAAAAAQAQATAAPAQQLTTAPSATVSTSGMAAFEACVISRESGGNPQAYNPSSGAGGLFQFLPSTWANTPQGPSYPGGAQTAPASVQEAAFAWVYARDGTADWAPYDGC